MPTISGSFISSSTGASNFLVDDLIADFFWVEGFYFGSTTLGGDFLTELLAADLRALTFCDTGFAISSSDSDESCLALFWMDLD